MYILRPRCGDAQEHGPQSFPAASGSSSYQDNGPLLSIRTGPAQEAAEEPDRQQKPQPFRTSKAWGHLQPLLWREPHSDDTSTEGHKTGKFPGAVGTRSDKCQRFGDQGKGWYGEYIFLYFDVLRPTKNSSVLRIVRIFLLIYKLNKLCFEKLQYTLKLIVLNIKKK